MVVLNYYYTIATNFSFCKHQCYFFPVFLWETRPLTAFWSEDVFGPTRGLEINSLLTIGCAIIKFLTLRNIHCLALCSRQFTSYVTAIPPCQQNFAFTQQHALQLEAAMCQRTGRWDVNGFLGVVSFLHKKAKTFSSFKFPTSSCFDGRMVSGVAADNLEC